MDEKCAVHDIKAYEAMAMLDLPDGAREKIGVRFNTLADSFNKIGQIGTDGALPLVSVLELHNIMREDTAGKLLTREEILSNAPEQYD